MHEKQPGTALDRFRAAVMADPAAQRMLAEPVDPAAFEARALAFAAAHDIPLAREDLLVRPAPLSGSDWPGAAWLPVALDETGVDWAHFAGAKPDRPFFEDSLRAARSRPFNRLFGSRTPLDAFVARATENLPPPRGLIFHMSRCGSTLVSQMLGAAPDYVVLAEPEPVDALLQLPLGPDAVRAMVAALGRSAPAHFLKTDAWHALMLPRFREAFPGVPWVFLYRDPVEVLVSHARRPGRHVVPGMVPALDGIAAGSMGMEYAARILARICAAVAGHGIDPAGLLVHYRELPHAVFTRILPHFGIEPTPADRALMARAARRDAKAPDAVFRPDGAAKHREASDAVRQAARHLAPVYAELEAIRASSPPAAV